MFAEFEGVGLLFWAGFEVEVEDQVKISDFFHEAEEAREEVEHVIVEEDPGLLGEAGGEELDGPERLCGGGFLGAPVEFLGEVADDGGEIEELIGEAEFEAGFFELENGVYV